MSLRGVTQRKSRRKLSESDQLNKCLTLVISNLGPGGAERVLSTMANYWAERGAEVTLITFTAAADDHYPLDSRINRVSLDILWNSKTVFSRPKDQFVRIYRIRHAITASRPDIVISFLDRTNVRVLLSLIGTGIPVIVSERINPAHWEIGRVWNGLRRLLYPRAASIVAQTEAVRQWIGRMARTDRVVVIPNAVRQVPLENRHHAAAYTPTVAAMGRMSAQKGFDLLLSAWARIGKEKTGWRLLLIGDGPLRDELEAQARQLGIEDSVNFAGVLRNPESILAEAEIFVLPSRFEGFPNALLEAMSLGIAVISCDCDSGPREIIRNDHDGLLVPSENPEALAQAIAHLMRDPVTRERYAAAAGTVIERFAQAKIMAQWEMVINNILHPESSNTSG